MSAWELYLQQWDEAAEAVDTYSVPVAVADLNQRLLAERPALMAGLWEEMRDVFLTDKIYRVENSRRGTAFRRGPAKSFEKARVQFEATGDRSAFDAILNVRYHVRGVSKRLAVLNGEELTWLADQYDVRAKSNGFEERFVRALAERAGERTVGAVCTGEEIYRIRASLTT